MYQARKKDTDALEMVSEDDGTTSGSCFATLVSLWMICVVSIGGAEVFLMHCPRGFPIECSKQLEK